MRRTAHLTYRAIGLLVEAGGWLAGLAVLVSLALVAWSVGLRYFLNQPEPWVDEAVGYVLVLCVMGAIADALRRGEHISVDLLTERLTPRWRTVSRVAGHLAALAVAAILVVEGWQMVAFSKMIGIRSIGYLDLEIWTMQLMVPAGGVLLGLAALAELLREAAGLPGPAGGGHAPPTVD